MVSDNLFFEAHLENVAYDLNVSPPVIYGEEAKQAAKRYGSLDHGAYLWKNNENTVALKNKDSISIAAHELRHAWQHTHGHKHFTYNVPTNQRPFRALLSRKIYQATYVFNRKEIDADKFAAAYCKRNRLTYDLRKVNERITINKVSRIAITFGLICMLSSIAYLMYVLNTY